MVKLESKIVLCIDETYELELCVGDFDPMYLYFDELEIDDGCLELKLKNADVFNNTDGKIVDSIMTAWKYLTS